MKLLELFAGTGSVGKAFTKYNWDVLGLDITKGHAIKCDILQWDYTAYKPGYFDAIHTSPPCTHYSIARTSAKSSRNLTLADALVMRTKFVSNAYFSAPTTISVCTSLTYVI